MAPSSIGTEPAGGPGDDSRALVHASGASSKPAADRQEAAADQPARKKRRRVATYVSDVDRRLIEHGVAPSWEDRVTDGDFRTGSMRDSSDRGDGANDRRLLENVPPHAQARA